MEIIDAQIHGVDPARAWGEHFSQDDVLAASAELAVASMDAVGVAGALMQWWPADTDAYVARHPDRFVGVPYLGWPEPEPERPDDYFAELAANPSMVGTRLVIGLPEDGTRVRQLQEGAFDASLAASQRHELPVFVLAHTVLPTLHETIRKFPSLPFIIDHLGLRYPSKIQKVGPEIFDEVPDVLDLAQYPNVALKFTSVPALSMEPYPFNDLWPHLNKIIDAFGVDRLMWGSDFTRVRALHSYREAIDFLLYHDGLSQSDKEMMFAGALREWVKWPENTFVDTSR